MKVQVKKNLIIFEETSEWAQLKRQLIKDYGASIAISWRCKSELGFTVREHKGLRPHSEEDQQWLGDDWKHKYYYHPEIHLDFYDEAQQSYFVLKYIKFD